jgi:pimeloyl-ACP methyl ester carboxylesterase
MPEATRGHGDSDKPEHDRDPYCPRDEQLRLADAIPGAELLVYEQVGHALHWEEPERAAADVAAFLSPRGPRRPRLAAVR